MNERLRELERAHRADPRDLLALRALADERKRRGEELLPDLVRRDPWWVMRVPWWTAAFRTTGFAADLESILRDFARRDWSLARESMADQRVFWPRQPFQWIDPLAEAEDAAEVARLRLLFRAPLPLSLPSHIMRIQ